MENISLVLLVLCCVFEGGLFKQIPQFSRKDIFYPDIPTGSRLMRVKSRGAATDYINICKRDPSTIDECARRSIETLRPKLIVGIPELDVPGLDPFYIEEIVTANSKRHPFSATGKDVKVTGAGNFSIKSLSVDLDTLTIRARVRFPRLHLEGRYKLNTQLLVLPLNGEGTLNADAVKCDAEMVLRGQVAEHNATEYIEFDKLDMDINIKDYRVRLEGLFNGDKALGEAANQAINQNRGEFLRSAKPYIEITVSNLLLDFANRIVKDLTLEQLLPNP